MAASVSGAGTTRGSLVRASRYTSCACASRRLCPKYVTRKLVGGCMQDSLAVQAHPADLGDSWGHKGPATGRQVYLLQSPIP